MYEQVVAENGVVNTAISVNLSTNSDNGYHIMVELYDCTHADRRADMAEFLTYIAARNATRVLNTYVHFFEPQGVTGSVLAEQGSIQVHTWPECKFVAFDTAWFGVDAQEKALDVVEQFRIFIGAQRAKMHRLVRGEPEESHDLVDAGAGKLKLGSHVVADLYDCVKGPWQHDIVSVLKNAAIAAHADLQYVDVQTTQEGSFVAGAVLSESHIFCYAQPEKGFVAIDSFTCGEKAIPDKAIDVLQQYFKAATILRRSVSRGNGFQAIFDK